MEQFTVENDPDLYDFIENWHDRILDEYDIINRDVKRKKPVRPNRLYQMAKGARR